MGAEWLDTFFFASWTWETMRSELVHVCGTEVLKSVFCILRLSVLFSWECKDFASFLWNFMETERPVGCWVAAANDSGLQQS